MTALDVAAPLAGGGLVGLGGALLWLGLGEHGGISGLFGALLHPDVKRRAFRAAFVAGLVAVGVAAAAFAPGTLGAPAITSLPLLGLAGFVGGAGAWLSGGCTSGHGVCGLGRLRGSSLVAVMTFMGTGAITVFLARHVVGGGP